MAIHMHLLIVPKLLFKNCLETKKKSLSYHYNMFYNTTSYFMCIVLLIYTLIELQQQIQTSKPLDFPRFTLVHLLSACPEVLYVSSHILSSSVLHLSFYQLLFFFFLSQCIPVFSCTAPGNCSLNNNNSDILSSFVKLIYKKLLHCKPLTNHY